MPVILVVEQDASNAERIRDVLLSSGYRIDTASNLAEALAQAQKRAPGLLIANGEVAQAEQLFAAFSRLSGGPGAIALVSESASTKPPQADEVLIRPFAEEDLLMRVRQCLEAAPRRPTPPPPASDSEQLTSADIFGDVLAEVEAEAKLSAPDVEVSAKAAPIEDIERRLEETLSGVILTGDSSSRPTQRHPEPIDDSAIDDLLDQTLSSLDIPTRSKKRKSPPPSPDSPAPVTTSQPLEIPAEETAPAAPTTEQERTAEQELVAGPESVDEPGTAVESEKADGAEPADQPQPALTESAIAAASEAEPSSSTEPATAVPPIESDALPKASTWNEVPPEEAAQEEVRAQEEVAQEVSSDRESTASLPPIDTDSLPTDFSIEIPPELEALGTPTEDAPTARTVPSGQVGAETDPPTVEAPTPTLGDTPFGETIDRDEAADEISTVRTDKDKGGVAAASAGPPLETDPAIHPESFPRQDDQFRTMVMPILDTAKETSAGENFGEYTLLDRIAIGGMAEVWRARRRGVEGFQKIVAIKKILSHLTGSADFVTMFIDEAKLAAQLNHNNIIQIYDLGKVSEDFFIAMEYVDGKDLRSILTASESAKRPMPVGLGLLVISAVARALDYAHRKRDFEDRALGLVHRDVSPQNVLISYEGEIKLCDFGIVKAVAKASTTQMGALKGKLQYMSPEQAWGKTVDARSDIFSLGSVMYELFTGTKLFAGESEISVLDAVRECRVPSLRESVTDLPEDVERIALKALAKDAGERYQTAGEMEHEIKAVLDTIKPTPSQKDLSAYLQELFAAAEESNGSSAVAGATATAPGNEAPRVEPGAGDSGISPEASPTEAPAAGETGAKPTGSSLLKWLIAALVVGGLIGAGFLYIQSQKAPSQPVPTPTTSTTPAVEQTTPVAPRPASQDEPSADVEGAIESASRDPATSTTESPSADPGESTAAGEPPAPAGTGSLDLEQMVSEELSSRAERLKRDFEEEKKRIEEELAKTRAAEKPVETSENEASEPDAGGDEPEGSAAPPESGGGR